MVKLSIQPNPPRNSKYLLIVQKLSIQDHQAGLIHEVYKHLKKSIDIEIFEYFATPLQCYKRDTIKSYSIDELYRKYPNAHLVIVSEGLELINTRYARPLNWAEKLKRWEKTSLITNTHPSEWANRETILNTVFQNIAPLTEQGIEATFSENYKEIDYWKAKTDYKFVKIPLQNKSIKMIELFLPTEIKELIAACSVNYGIHWSETIKFAKLLSMDGNDLLTFDTFKQLLRIEWFRKSYIPEDIKEAIKKEWLTDKIISKKYKIELNN